MLKRKLKNQRNLILWNGKYYVVNDLTFELLDMFDKNIKLKDIEKRTDYNQKELKILYSEIEQKLLSNDYYEDNLKFV